MGPFAKELEVYEEQCIATTRWQYRAVAAEAEKKQLRALLRSAPPGKTDWHQAVAQYLATCDYLEGDEECTNEQRRVGRALKCI